MGFSCGIVGLPNVGKSTIFNALTSAKAASENFPFCTIEPNTGVVPVPDPRLNKLAEIAKSDKLIPTQMTFVDIAGLIKGASKGEGLGNQFLSHIRNVDAIAHVVRCFEDENVIHVDGGVDPLRDISTIETELILSDLDSVQKQLQRTEKGTKSGDKNQKQKLEILKLLENHLSSGKLAKNFSHAELESIQEEMSYLLTSKPVLYVANVNEDQANNEPNPDGSSLLDKVARFAAESKAPVVVISGKVEAEVAELPKDERVQYLEALGLKHSGLESLTLAGYQLLELITYFTVGPKEARAWTISKNTLAPQAAGKIHSDFEKGFIRAEVIAYEDYATLGGELKAKEAGKLRTEGKDYLVKDGDVMHFRFNN